MGVRTTIILSCLAMLALAPVAQACRIIPDVWPPRPPTVMPPPPAYLASPILTRAHTAEIDITDNVAKVSVAATFYNPNGGVMEGTYFFPIEPDAVIRDFSMLINGKEQKAELLDADKARQIYEDIVRQMKDPGLLEYVGTRMLKARVYPIPARGEVQVRLQYHQVVTSDGGLSHFRYPLLSAKPNAETIDNVALRVSLNSSAPVKLFYSPSHVIDAIRKGDRAVTGGFEQEKVVPEQDFDLYWSIDASDIGVSTLAYQPKGEDGYCLISMTPKVDFAKDRVEPKDVVFVFDKSGSMAGDKMKQAKAAHAFCLNSLNAGDRFAVILFSTDVEVVTDAIQSLNEEDGVFPGG